jgi:hypothetical protein
MRFVVRALTWSISRTITRAPLDCTCASASLVNDGLFLTNRTGKLVWVEMEGPVGCFVVFVPAPLCCACHAIAFLVLVVTHCFLFHRL